MYERLRRAVEGERFPLALIDVAALDRNIDRLLTPVRAHRKKLRLATKSVRCVAVIRRILERAGALAGGLMCYAVREAQFLIEQELDDLFVAYPIGSAQEAALLAELNRAKLVSITADSTDQLELLDRAGRAAGVRIPVVLEVDLSYRRLNGAVHLGVRRSPLFGAGPLLAFADRLARRPGIRFHGVMGYEAQVAGLSDDSPPVRLMKRLSLPAIAETRRAIDEGLRAKGLAPIIFNGGGTGSLRTTAAEPWLTEVTAGSGFLDPLLFDGFRELALEPAAYFALQVVRHPASGMVTCHGGGYIASGQPGRDRSPQPVLPRGLSLLPFEGAGEVQTPLRLPRGTTLPLGAPVFFRHAKAGELAEHFSEYLLVEGDRIVDRAPTYRGMGQCFL